MDIHRPALNPRRHLRAVEAPLPAPSPVRFRDREIPLHSASVKALTIIIVLLTAAVFIYPAARRFVGAWITRGKTMDPSLYVPKAHVVADRAFLHDFMDEYAFVDLVTTTPSLRITHIPTVLDRGMGRYGTVLGHIE